MYTPDETSKQWFKKWFISPLLEQHQSYCNMTQDEKAKLQDDIQKGVVRSDSGVRVPPTTYLYSVYMIKVLGHFQANIKKGGGEGTLEGGRLQVWQFTAFKEPMHIRPYSKDQFEREILSKFSSDATKKHCVAASTNLLNGINEFLSSSHAREHFKSRKLPRQEKLNEVEMNNEVEEEINKEKMRINNIMIDIKQARFNHKLNDNIKAMNQKEKKFEVLLESDEQVDLTKAIRDYLKTPKTRKLFSDLKDLAEDDTIVISPYQINYLTRGVVKIMIVQSGHRPGDAFGAEFTRAKFAKACRDPPARHPYAIGKDPANPDTVTPSEFRPGTLLRVIQDPHQHDPADPEDPQNRKDSNAQELFEATACRAVEVDTMNLMNMSVTQSVIYEPLIP